MPSEVLKKAVKDGLITQKQYDKMPEALLLGIVKKGGNGGKKKGKSPPKKRKKKRKSKK
tara:strand:+ start:5299 stop:5475 length:177 start_codon:yes stop_codon:yes gene_type:complete